MIRLLKMKRLTTLFTWQQYYQVLESNIQNYAMMLMLLVEQMPSKLQEITIVRSICLQQLEPLEVTISQKTTHQMILSFNQRPCMELARYSMNLWESTSLTSMELTLDLLDTQELLAALNTHLTEQQTTLQVSTYLFTFYLTFY
jgi:hypothetical protein